MVTIKEGDLFSAPDGIICHQVDCKGVMERGIAKTFKYVFPETYKIYKDICTHEKDLLGKNLFHTEATGKACCMFAQLDWRGHNVCNTNYAAFRECCKGIKSFVDFHRENYAINMPYKIGCGLGGGDWLIIKDILEEEFKDYNLILWKIK
jgi:hypothetical protein